MRTILMVAITMSGILMELDAIGSNLIDALCKVESNNNATAVGDKGKAKGILQIHKICVDDVNRIYGTKYVHDDAFNVEKARKICELYLLHYGKAYIKRTGKNPTELDLARIWNAGPKGYEKASTLAYADKVGKVLQGTGRKAIVRKAVKKDITGLHVFPKNLQKS